MRRSDRPTPTFSAALLLALLLLAPASARAQATDWPGPDAAWERRAPEAAGMDAALLAQAVAFAREIESTAPRDLELAHYTSFGREPFGSAVGPFRARVNLLALAALNVWRRPLPEVLRELVMEPIDASPTWRWLGYDNSWVVLDGLEVQSVSGGGHWGGGMFISAFDQARFGLLTLRDGRWRERGILSPEWMRMARTPTPAQPGYGFMNFFLNGGRERYPSAPEEAFVHLGAGTNMVYVDPVHDLVIVARWIDGRAADGLIQRVLASIVE